MTGTSQHRLDSTGDVSAKCENVPVTKELGRCFGLGNTPTERLRRELADYCLIRSRTVMPEGIIGSTCSW